MIVHRIDLADLLIKMQISELKILNVDPEAKIEHSSLTCLT